MSKGRGISRKGYVTLLMVLLVGTVGVTVALSLLFFSIISSRTSLAFQDSNLARALGDACGEAALQMIWNSVSFTGSGSLSFAGGSCSYTVTSLGGQARDIHATGSVGTIVRKVKIVIDQITPRIRLVSWEEVSDF